MFYMKLVVFVSNTSFPSQTVLEIALVALSGCAKYVQLKGSYPKVSICFQFFKMCFFIFYNAQTRCLYVCVYICVCVCVFVVRERQNGTNIEISYGNFFFSTSKNVGITCVCVNVRLAPKNTHKRKNKLFPCCANKTHKTQHQ